jgi:hypothetical protein
MSPLYVAGPYAAPTLADTERNVRRALAVGRLAVERGYAPIVPHAAGWLGLYGSAEDDGSLSLPRSRALLGALHVATMVGAVRGHLWAIMRDDRSLSEGSDIECTAWSTAYRDAIHSTRIPPGVSIGRTWDVGRVAAGARSGGYRRAGGAVNARQRRKARRAKERADLLPRESPTKASLQPITDEEWARSGRQLTRTEIEAILTEMRRIPTVRSQPASLRPERRYL